MRVCMGSRQAMYGLTSCVGRALNNLLAAAIGCPRACAACEQQPGWLPDSTLPGAVALLCCCSLQRRLVTAGCACSDMVVTIRRHC